MTHNDVVLIIDYIKRNLGPDLTVNTSLSAKEAYNFATLYTKVLEDRFTDWSEHEHTDKN